MSSVSTHVLDSSRGCPAAGVPVRLERAGDGEPLAETVTGDDGRVAALGPDDLGPGTYRVVFGTGTYFARTGQQAFYPEVTVSFLVGGRRRPLPCTARAQPVRLRHLPGELTMGIILGANQYGKAEVRVVKVDRDTPRHEIHDLSVTTTLRGDFADAHTSGDQSNVLPTDSQKNTVFAFAKQYGVGQIEDFALSLARHFTETVPAVTSARVGIEAYDWDRVGTDAGPATTMRSSGAGRTSARRR